MIRRAAAYILLTGTYGLTWLVAVLARKIPRRSWKPTGRIMITGAFYNPNWYLSHVTPLAHSGVTEVILVVDEPQSPLEKVTFVCPPRWASRLLSRVGARSIWMVIAGFRYRPDMYIGYYLAPGACTALVVGRLVGRPACYQMTGGPVGIIGGGFAAVDSIEGSLGKPSRLIESLAIRVIRQFELVVVRGNKAREFLKGHGMKESVVVITGSVNDRLQPPQDNREIDLIYVGRLSHVKQVHQFIEIVDAVRHAMPGVRAVIVGDGPLKTDLQAYTEQLGLAGNVEFFGKMTTVAGVLARSRIFVLTSQSEGLSIAMAEAMAAGVVPVVADVGELGDLVVSGMNGYLVAPNNIHEYATHVRSLLQDQAAWAECSREAIETAKGRCGIEVISGQWRQHLRAIIARASGCRTEDIFN